ncbi:PREDICTED: B3 domain-containing protein At2g16210-like isoform X1 [Fragaria vesca subsp. vesca]|uniref:B3 domain-containing protein At2g16210-like isoform X1 n=1 Tax=Fragaria vesca subsp. vesca TaxID=101020 RepID=UPI0002C2EEF4|nr:PREDICTED: B3 domain-containing protein At2g16210-like isoform X1 [Fragaria vesca subsp. vesca]
MGSCSRRRKDEDTNCPGFYKCVDESVLHKGKLQIPKDFCWFDGVVPQQCHLQTLYGSWNVDVKRIKRVFFLEKGLEEFVVGNSLKQGESLVLQYVGIAKFFVQIYGLNHCERSKASEISLVDSENDEEDVIIIDSDSDPEAQDSEISLDSESKCPRDLVCGRKVSRRGGVRNIATISSSGNPCFSIRICRSHVNRGPLLTPRSFLRNISKPKKVKLQVENVCWNVIWLHPYNKSSRFSGGWVPFFKENKVKEGDICDFELISKSTEVAVIKVTIRRM